MNPKEFRIGNLINPDIPVMVEAFMLQPENKVVFKPIPLTEDWLLRFGFEVSEDLGDMVYYEIPSLPNTLGVKYEEELYWSISKVNGDDWTCLIWDSAEFQYVHQLQNIFFALSGKELQLKS